jgi:N-acetylmuramoyl-L-alanine amidase
MSAFPPDSFIVTDVVPSPNVEARKDGRTPDMILLHYTGMRTGAAALERLCAPDSKVSAHYVVFEDGRIVQCVPEDRRAWHAGVASWAGEPDINSCSIGIEIVNPGHEFGYPDFPLRQTAAVISLCRSILTRRGPLAPDRILGHSDVAPARKQDPGEGFPWERLWRSGLGHWTEPAPLSGGALFASEEEGPAVRALQAMLALYGYGVEITGVYDRQTRQSVAAFQRHFRPARVDGEADASTVATLKALIDGLGRKSGR